MFSISLILKVFVIVETLAFSRQLSIIYLFSLQMKHFSFFMGYDISASEIQGIGVIVPQKVLDRCKKKMLILDIISAWEKLVTALKKY